MAGAARAGGAYLEGRRRAVAAVLLSVLTGAAGCARPAPTCPDPADNPGRLYVNAMRSVEHGQLDAAERALDRALQCAPDFHAALSARALVMARRARAAADPAQQATYRQRARADLDAGAKNLRSPEEQFLYAVTAIRTLIALQDAGWLARAWASYDTARGLSVDESALLYYKEREALPYFMAQALVTAGEYEQARALYGQVFARRGVGRWNGLAAAGWRRTDEILRATAGTTPQGIGRVIAVQSSVSRAQLAALLVDEMGLGQLLDAPPATRAPPLLPADVRGHPYRRQIVAVLSWHLRGIELVYDPTAQAYLFEPDALVRRKELAVALEDMLIRLTGDPGLARAFIGQETSLFSDVSPTAAWYNACATAVSRGLMESDLHGAFRPDAAVAGADALLAVRRLRQSLVHN